MESMTSDERVTGAEQVLWDLSDLYPSTTDPVFTGDLETITDRCAAFHRSWKGKLGSLDVASFITMVTEYEDLAEALDRMGSFAQLIWSTDTEDPKNGRLLQMVRETGARAAQHLVFLGIELAGLPDETFEQLLNAPELASRRHWLERVLEYRPYNLSEEVEKVLAVKNLAARAAWVRMHDELMASQVFRLNGKEYTEAQILKLLHEADRNTRKAAAESVCWPTTWRTTSCVATRRGSQAGTWPTRLQMLRFRP
jgi:oligoendopeptidase F